MPTKQKPAGVADPTPVRAEAVASLAGEVWKPVFGYEGLYEVSNMGRVYSLGRSHPNASRNGSFRALYAWINRPRLMKGSFDINGYVYVRLTINAVKRIRKVHHLVLEAFVGLRPDGTECCHGDGNRANNCVANLRWGTPKDNAKDREHHGTTQCGERHYAAKLTDAAVAFIRANAKATPAKELAAKYDVSTALVYQIIARRAWRHVGKGAK